MGEYDVRLLNERGRSASKGEKRAVFVNVTAPFRPGQTFLAHVLLTVTAV
jgi:hypothetical protein